MNEQDLQRLRRDLVIEIADLRYRIRRYTLDKQRGDEDKHLLEKLNELWPKWRDIRKKFYDLGSNPAEDKLREVEGTVLEIDRAVDVIQRDLVSSQSFNAGVWTTVVLGAMLILSLLFYLTTHGVTLLPLDFSEFEPLAEWGPLKYVEVAFWSFFGVMSWLIYLAAWYTARRDFDKWYQPWYFATAARAPLLTMLLMVIVLEFVEYWADDASWMQALTAEGNKFYFIVFMSFSLGLISEQSSAIARDLAEGVGEALRGVVQRFVRWLRSKTDPGSPEKK